MQISTRHIGARNGKPSKIIELTVNNFGSTITQDIANLNGLIDQSLIDSLLSIADELKEQNRLVMESWKNK